MAKSGTNKENTKIRRALNRHFRRVCKQTTPLLYKERQGEVEEWNTTGELQLFKKTSGWLTW